MALRFTQHKRPGMSDDATFNLSRLFIRYYSKFLGGEDAQRNDSSNPGGEEAAQLNSGSQIRNAIKVTNKFGVASAPSQEVLDLAKKYCDFKLHYYRIMTITGNKNELQADLTKAPTATAPSKVEQIYSCLAEGYPVIFAIKIFQKQNPDTHAWTISWNPTNWQNMIRTSSGG